MVGALLVGALGVGGATAWAPTAWAQGGANPKSVEQARQRMDKGQALFAQGRYKEALEEFEGAYDAHPFGAFLYNAALAAEKAGDKQRAIARYNQFIASDPNSPYVDQIKTKVRELEEELSKVPPEGQGGEPNKPPEPAPAAPVPADQATLNEVRSLVFVESDPPGAPIEIHERVVATAAAFRPGATNPGWRRIVSGEKTPKDLSLKVGHYHVVIEAFQDYKRSATDINLAPGHVYTFKANLSQGEFLAFLRIRSNVEGAKVYLDDPPPHRGAPWLRTPKGGQVNQGEHEIWVEAPGYKPFRKKVVTPHGETVDVDAQLERVDHGYLIVDGNIGVMEIKVDDQPHSSYNSRGEPVRLRLPAGKHKVLFDGDGRKIFEGELEVPRGQEQAVHARLAELYPRGAAIGFGIASGAFIVGGVLMHLESQKPEDHEPDLITFFEVGRFVAFGLGGVLTGLSIFYSIYDPYPDSLIKLDKPRDFPEDGEEEKPQRTMQSARVRPVLSPWMSPDGGGLGVGVIF
jgi:hypothetical protein